MSNKFAGMTEQEYIQYMRGQGVKYKKHDKNKEAKKQKSLVKRLSSPTKMINTQIDKIAKSNHNYISVDNIKSLFFNHIFTINRAGEITGTTDSFTAWFIKYMALGKDKPTYIRYYSKTIYPESCANILCSGFLDAKDIQKDLGLKSLKQARRLLTPKTDGFDHNDFKRIVAPCIFRVWHLIQEGSDGKPKVYGKTKPIKVVSTFDYLEFLKLRNQNRPLNSKSIDALTDWGKKYYKRWNQMSNKERMEDWIALNVQNTIRYDESKYALQSYRLLRKCAVRIIKDGIDMTEAEEKQLQQYLWFVDDDKNCLKHIYGAYVNMVFKSKAKSTLLKMNNELQTELNNYGVIPNSVKKLGYLKRLRLKKTQQGFEDINKKYKELNHLNKQYNGVTLLNHLNKLYKKLKK